MASMSWNDSSFELKDVSIPQSVDIDVVCAKEDMSQVRSSVRCTSLMHTFCLQSLCFIEITNFATIIAKSLQCKYQGCKSKLMKYLAVAWYLSHCLSLLTDLIG